MRISKWPHNVKTPLDPDSTLDYLIDWSDWLGAGESIVDSSWAASGATVSQSAYTSTTATAWVTGASGSVARLTNTITTDSTPVARVDERTLIIPVRSR